MNLVNLVNLKEEKPKIQFQLEVQNKLCQCKPSKHCKLKLHLSFRTQNKICQGKPSKQGKPES